jgi:hypothetical protein
MTLTHSFSSSMLINCPGRPGAAGLFEPRQGRKTATVRRRSWVPPVSCPDIDSTINLTASSLIISAMSPKRWIFFVLAAITGIGIGLYYGWVISPVQYVDTTPSTLRAEFRADYTLMVAETYQSEQNLNNAARRLAILGSQPPAQIVSFALNFAQQNKYSPTDIVLLQNLGMALQVWKPGSEISLTPTGSFTGEIATTPSIPGKNQP